MNIFFIQFQNFVLDVSHINFTEIRNMFAFASIIYHFLYFLIVFKAASLVLSTTGSEHVLWLVIIKICTTLEKNLLKYSTVFCKFLQIHKLSRFCHYCFRELFIEKCYIKSYITEILKAVRIIYRFTLNKFCKRFSLMFLFEKYLMTYNRLFLIEIFYNLFSLQSKFIKWKSENPVSNTHVL